MTLVYKKCPSCGSMNTGEIRYGEPSIEYPSNENIRFGGCCFSVNSPKYFCHVCDNEWNLGEAIYGEYFKIDERTK